MNEDYDYIYLGDKENLRMDRKIVNLIFTEMLPCTRSVILFVSFQTIDFRGSAVVEQIGIEVVD